MVSVFGFRFMCNNLAELDILNFVYRQIINRPIILDENFYKVIWKRGDCEYLWGYVRQIYRARNVYLSNKFFSRSNK